MGAIAIVWRVWKLDVAGQLIARGQPQDYVKPHPASLYGVCSIYSSSSRVRARLNDNLNQDISAFGALAAGVPRGGLKWKSFGMVLDQGEPRSAVARLLNMDQSSFGCCSAKPGRRALLLQAHLHSAIGTAPG